MSLSKEVEAVKGITDIITSFKVEERHRYEEPVRDHDNYINNPLDRNAAIVRICLFLFEYCPFNRAKDRRCQQLLRSEIKILRGRPSATQKGTSLKQVCDGFCDAGAYFYFILPSLLFINQDNVTIISS